MRRLVAIFFVLAVLASVIGYADRGSPFYSSFSNLGLATNFMLPVYPESNYTSSANKFLDLSSPGYHLGEDWNSGDGSDLNDPVYAITNGIVQRVVNPTNSDSWGKVVCLKHKLVTGEVVYSVYAHLSQIEPEVVEGRSVSYGQKIGGIGDANGYYSAAHLHFEIRKTVWNRDNPYVGTITRAGITNYYAPTVFIDCHRQLKSQTLRYRALTGITPARAVPAYLIRLYVYGSYYTLEQAARNYLIDPYLYYRNPDGTTGKERVDLIFGLPYGDTYYLLAKTAGAQLVWYEPTYREMETVAKLDLVEMAFTYNYRNPRPETLSPTWLSYYPTIPVSAMQVTSPSGQSVSFLHLYDPQTPFWRFGTGDPEGIDWWMDFIYQPLESLD